ncbi:MAG: glutathione S-transferase [Myxococcales bacterium]|nr:glutathione S-transferase [Myxococcales bacterium]MCB9628298.1 glutathione S-transferase [Sandaracinaceae bacterium]
MLRLVVGPLNYSSWSMRPWLVLHHAGAAVKTHEIPLFVGPDWQEQVLSFSGAGKVPVLVDKNLSIHESLAICEYVAELHPEAQLWPADRGLRARGRAISAEMASSFGALREEFPTNLRSRASTPREPSPAAARDIARVFDIWQASLATSPGPFLLGAFSIADAMYFPVLSRFRTYGIALPTAVEPWAERLWAHPSVVALAAEAVNSVAVPRYDARL